MEKLNNSKNSTKKEPINELPIIAIDFIDKLRKEKIESMSGCDEMRINSTSDVSSFIESNSNGDGGVLSQKRISMIICEMAGSNKIGMENKEEQKEKFDRIIEVRSEVQPQLNRTFEK